MRIWISFPWKIWKKKKKQACQISKKIWPNESEYEKVRKESRRGWKWKQRWERQGMGPRGETTEAPRGETGMWWVLARAFLASWMTVERASGEVMGHPRESTTEDRSVRSARTTLRCSWSWRWACCWACSLVWIWRRLSLTSSMWEVSWAFLSFLTFLGSGVVVMESSALCSEPTSVSRFSSREATEAKSWELSASEEMSWLTHWPR